MKKLFSNKNTLIMGVINITPDSFSDGGKFNDTGSLQAHVEDLISSGSDILDFGAESTAPNSSPITAAEEMNRFRDLLFPVLAGLKDRVISIDTYRPQVFLEVYKYIKGLKLNNTVIWNDVSGVVDFDTKNILRQCSDVIYVLSHNNISSKKQTSFHMDYVKDFDSTELFLDNFLTQSKRKIKSLREYKDRIIFDPCFGFAKTYEQNLELLDNISVLEGLQIPCLVGLSRKSFLKKQTSNLEELEMLHLSYLESIRATLSGELIFRMHTPKTDILSS